jgi:hypothetical protein
MNAVKRMLEAQNGKCTKCGIKVATDNYAKSDSTQMSIDRVNNKLGHLKSNVVINCYGCNLANSNESKTKSILYLNFDDW